MTEHKIFHQDSSLWAKGELVDGVSDGYWEWFRKDGTKMSSGYFKQGQQVGEWTTYAKNGDIVKTTNFSSPV